MDPNGNPALCAPGLAMADGGAHPTDAAALAPPEEEDEETLVQSLTLSSGMDNSILELEEDARTLVAEDEW